MDGKKELKITPRELQILREIALTGNRPAVIAADLGISPHTVKTHMYSAYRALGVSSLTEAFLTLGWLNPK